MGQRQGWTRMDHIRHVRPRRSIHSALFAVGTSGSLGICPLPRTKLRCLSQRMDKYGQKREYSRHFQPRGPVPRGFLLAVSKHLGLLAVIRSPKENWRSFSQRTGNMDGQERIYVMSSLEEPSKQHSFRGGHVRHWGFEALCAHETELSGPSYKGSENQRYG